MISLKCLFRKKKVKVCIITIGLILTSILLLISLEKYFTRKQNDIFLNYSKLVVINDYDILPNLQKIGNISNIKRVVAFKENNNYDIFKRASYRKYDNNGNLIDYSDNNEDKIMWEVLENDGLKDYILVYSDKEFNLNLKENEIVIGINHFWYTSYDKSYYDKIINRNIGFLYAEENIEFLIKNVLSTETSILIINNNLYENLLKTNKKIAYTAQVLSFKSQTQIKSSLKGLSDSENYIYSIMTFYENDAGNEVSNLYDLLDLLKLISYISVIIFIVTLIIITCSIIGDLRNDVVLNKKLGFSNFQIIVDIVKKIFLVYISGVMIAFVISYILIMVINCIFKINIYFSM